MKSGGDLKPVVFLANGNLNGRTIRLVADHFDSTHRLPVRLISTGALLRWPEERSHPHTVQATPVDPAEAERLIAGASAYVFAATFDPIPNRMVGVARRAGTPSFCIVADVDFGAARLDPADPSSLPDRIGIGDPITSSLLTERGVPPSIIGHVGSPYLDSILSVPALPRPGGRELRVGLLFNPDGIEARKVGYSEEDVFWGTREALKPLPESRLTIRPHPRLDPSWIEEAVATIDSAVVESADRRTMVEFVASHHLTVASYSTGLLVTKALGRPAVSFQPSPDGRRLRGEAFSSWGIPIVSTSDELSRSVAESRRSPSKPLPFERLLFQPHQSLEEISREIRVLSEGRE
jgi:hypothetical protein